jgi:hypothetical protein
MNPEAPRDLPGSVAVDFAHAAASAAQSIDKPFSQRSAAFASRLRPPGGQNLRARALPWNLRGAIEFKSGRVKFIDVGGAAGRTYP